MSRIIAGALGGRKLVAPSGSRTRPTSDRVREALFSALGHLGCLDDARVLDLFAGSGALGLEALSRGGRSLVAVDSDRSAVAACRANVECLGVSASATVLQRSASAYLAEPTTEPFDLVLVDPPYDLTERQLADVLGALTGRLAEGAVVVVERSRRSPEPTWPPGIERFRQSTYGETVVWLAEPVGPA